MTIDRLGLSQALQGLDPASQAVSRVTPGAGDTAAISGEAVSRTEFYRSAEIVHAQPDVRADRVAEVRARMADPDYFSTVVLQRTADLLIDQLLG